MNDPHVVALTFRVKHADDIDFKKAAPRTVERSTFRVTLDAGQARVEMLEHFATEKEARDAVEPFLHEWELAADLKYPRDRFRFVYKPPPEIIDRSPPAGEVIHVETANLAITGMEVVAHIGRGSWPEPPAEIAITPDVKALHTRWLDHLDGKERLLAAAYWALTMIKAAPGPPSPAAGPRITRRRRDASAHFNIELDVLCTLGELTSARGGVDEGWKAEGRSSPLTRGERKWLKAAFKALVERAALQAYYNAPPPVRLTMKDLTDSP